MKLARFAVEHPVTLGMLILSAIVLGVISVGRIPLESFPSLSSTSVSVSVNYPSASPEEIERKITIPLEQSLALLENLETISSSSGNNSSNVRIEFTSGTDMDLAVLAVRDRVDQTRVLLPPEIDNIRIRRWQTDDSPILDADLAWKGEEGRLFDIVRKVVEPRLLRIDGVANVTIDGIEEKQLIVELDQQRLESHNISLNFLAQQLRANNVNISVGRVLDAGLRYQTRAQGEFQLVDEIGDLPIPGRNLKLSDLGRVTYGYPEKTRYERLNGHDAVEIEIYKASTANVVDVAKAARAALLEISAENEELDIRVTRDRAEMVLGELNKLTDTALLGGFLAVVIIFLFLRSIRSTIVIGMAIPLSVCCVFIGIYIAREFFGSPITLNLVSMMGLMLAIGMLVDPAVVTLESIFRRQEEEGEEPRKAAILGTKEVGMAVVASALTTMCVFIPFFFLSSSRMSRWMGDAGLTICLAIAVSTLVALTVIPLASSRLFHSKYARYDGRLKIIVLSALLAGGIWKLTDIGWKGILAWFHTTGARVLASITGMEWTTGLGLLLLLLALAVLIRYLRRHGMRTSYVQLLGWTLNHRLITMIAAVALMGSGIFLYSRIEQHGSPHQPERRVDITVEAERSYSLGEVDSLFHGIEQDLLANASPLDLESISTRINQRGGRITARLVDADEGRLSTMEAGMAIRRRLPEQVGIVYKMGRERGWSGEGLGVEVQLKGIDPDVLEVLSQDVKAQMAQLPGVVSVDTSLENGEEEIQVAVDREQTLSYGLSPQDVATTISTALGDRRTSSFKSPEREIGIVLQLEEEDRVSLEQLKNTTFEGRNDNPVQLAALADFHFAESPKSLQRQERQQTLTIFANTRGQQEAFALNEPVVALMESISLPPGYTWDLGRQARWMQEDAQDNNFTLLFAVLLIYLIMASLFESLIHPFTIMFAIPFSLIGVSIGLWALHVPLDNNGMLGMLILFGIVVNNGIVLIDHINQYRRAGMARREAILRGGQNRMRPILMTAATTILNLMPLVLPMVYGTSEGFARRWGPVGLVVVSGLATSTILTLVLAPTLYSLLDDLGLWVRRVVRTAWR
ncbi:MAG: efflux RND transporter permease subunit [Candidatus Eisenbacteria bacterium]|uniref:Efflux RND transporter permease subunit n=1 Tax=Eiseniibacteriota bacterium TaxID=2212470 RepID=A0A948RUK4_UNCEI|nr:efflux RND transporter permease subunit [Candidatus Eisenbacteria bacterium]